MSNDVFLDVTDLDSAINKTYRQVSNHKEMCYSSFLPTASPIDLPFKANSYLSLPFVPHQHAELQREALKQ